MKVVTRIAPSPTGQMHIGTVRTALFNYLFAKQHNGTYFVRIEDTDKERNKEEWVDAIWKDFEWCGLIPDAKYRTSDRIDRHKEFLHILVQKDSAYVSKEPKKDDASQMVEVVRLRNHGESVTFNDLVRGAVTFDTSELGDFVIARSIEDPLYHFAVVVDDGDTGVTHVLRAEEHISNTPRQILIQEALGFPRPVYGHLPLILAPDRSKLSKRKHGASVENYRAQGFLPEALVNYLALLGWNPGTEQEIFAIDELIQAFSLEHVHKGGAIFDIEKLKWYNREYLRKLPEADFRNYYEPTLKRELEARNISFDPAISAALIGLLRFSIDTSEDFAKAIQAGEYDYFFVDPTPEADKIPEKKSNTTEAIEHLEYAHKLLEAQDSFVESAIKESLWNYATEKGRGAVLWPLRYSLSGKAKSPDPFMIASIIGKAATLRRITNAVELLRAKQ